MAYRIQYETNSSCRKGSSILFRILLSLVFFVCFSWGISHFWQEGRELLKLLVIPGNPDITLEAAEVFSQDISCGVSLKDAWYKFVETAFGHVFSG